MMCPMTGVLHAGSMSPAHRARPFRCANTGTSHPLAAHEVLSYIRLVRWPGDRGRGNLFEESPGSTERRCRLTAGGGDPRDSATEMTPPKGPVFFGRLAPARLKWCGKSAPRLWQQRRHGKPHREQDQIGTARDVFRIAVRVGRVRCVATHIPEEWSSSHFGDGQNPAYRPSDF